jgi:alpha-beta hydrolase superfamily lysophospholipase
LHCREQAPQADHGVVLCPPIGYEQIHAHRSLRHLADALAEGGFPVLRFDYHGTGDSAGSGDDAECVATWLMNVRDARSWLKERLGCRRISLIGLRLGATLAVQSAAEQAVDGLLLWAPVVKGRAYVREIRALSLTAAVGDRSAGDRPGDVEAAGFVLTEQTAQQFAQLNLLGSRPLCRRALIMPRDDAPADLGLLEHFKALGIEAEQAAQPGYADMMAEPHYCKPPRQAIARAVDWFLAGTCNTEGAGAAAPLNNARPAADLLPLPHSVGYAAQEPQPLRERALLISQRPNLFGVLSEHPEVGPEDLPSVLLLNAGSSYRVGPNRLYVSLARGLAARGFRCLRMDFCGLGDSLSADAARENDPYPATAFRDVDLALKYLRKEFGAERVVVMGLCSGAYAAFQAAAQLSDPALVESVLINPLTFFWAEGMSLEAAPALKLKSFHDSIASAWQPAKWLKLLSGRSKLGVVGALKLLVERWWLRKAPVRQTSAGGANMARDGYPAHPLKEDLPGDLDRVVQAGRRLACFFSRSDPGYDILALHAGRKMDDLLRRGKMSVYFMDDADHTFSRLAARRALEKAIGNHLAERYQRSTN